MNLIWTIAKRELSSFFDSLMAYILLASFLGLNGFFTWMYGADVFLQGQASLRAFFSVAFWTLFFFIPAITMRQLAEERRTGTIELLLTKPISNLQLVAGKFLGSLLLMLIAIGFTLPYYFSLTRLGSVDHGAIISGYLGLILVSAAYIAIGLFASSITSNQIVSFLVALFIGMFFHLIFDVLSGSTTGLLANLFNRLSVSTHYEALTRGVIDSKDIIFFVSLAGLFILLTENNIAKRNQL